MSNKRSEPTEPKQIEFFTNLIDNGGNVPQAAEAAGYSKTHAYHLAKKYQNYLLDKVQGHIYLSAVKAAKTLIDGLDEDGKVPNAKVRIDSAKDILDRSGIVKTEKSEIKVDSPNGIFILPAKAVDSDEPDNT